MATFAGADVGMGGGASGSGSVTESSSSTCVCSAETTVAGAEGESRRRFLLEVGGERRDEDGDLRLRGECGGDSGSEKITVNNMHICG